VSVVINASGVSSIQGFGYTGSVSGLIRREGEGFVATMFAIHGTSIGFGKRPFETPDHWPLRMSQTGILEGWIEKRLF
jgi:hypothetical protein